jgi:hypothetical protein
MLALPGDAPVTLELTDGRTLSGTPAAGPSLAEDDVEELVLTHPAWLTKDGWERAGAAVLVPLSTVKTVTFARDPLPVSRTSASTGTSVRPTASGSHS